MHIKQKSEIKMYIVSDCPSVSPAVCVWLAGCLASCLADAVTVRSKEWYSVFELTHLPFITMMRVQQSWEPLETTKTYTHSPEINRFSCQSMSQSDIVMARKLPGPEVALYVSILLRSCYIPRLTHCNKYLTSIKCGKWCPMNLGQVSVAAIKFGR